VTAHARASLSFPPRLLGASEAAAYLGISATTLRGLGIPQRQLGGRVLWDRLDLDAYASSLPYKGGDQGENSCDAVFD
jgi:hypothetical protein